MTLLSTQEIKQGLDREFMPLEPMLTGLRLIEGGLSDAALDAFERNLDLLLPPTFREVVKKYDFGRLTIGPVVFCNTGDYLAELTKLNTTVAWWSERSRPVNLLMVANSDPFAILLNLESGEVMAMDAERGLQAACTIAHNFDLLVRGLGTTMLGRNEATDRISLGAAVASEVGAAERSYWLQLAK